MTPPRTMSAPKLRLEPSLPPKCKAIVWQQRLGKHFKALCGRVNCKRHAIVVMEQPKKRPVKKGSHEFTPPDVSA